MTTEVDVTLRPKGDIRPILVENLLASQSQISTLVVGKEISRHGLVCLIEPCALPESYPYLRSRWMNALMPPSMMF